MAKLIEKLKKTYKRADTWSGGWLGVLAQSYIHFLDIRGPEAAAGLAYYALFALFPLMLLLVGMLGFILESSSMAYFQTLTFILTLFPFAEDLINQNLGYLQERRSAISVVGLIGLFWSSSGFFNILARGVNRAWPSVKLRGLVQSRLIALGMVGVLFLLLLLSLVSSTLLSLLPQMVETFGLGENLLLSTVWGVVLRIVPAVFTFLLFIGLYRWVPNKTVRWKAVIIGAFVVSLAWEAAKIVFTVYLSSGFARFEIIYGSLGTLIALMVWIYVSSLIALMGAHLVAGLDTRAEQQEEDPKDAPERRVEGPRMVPKEHIHSKGAKEYDADYPGHEVDVEKRIPKSVRG